MGDRDGKAVVEYGESPHERVKQGLSEMSSSIRTARRALKTVQRSLEDAQEDRDDEARVDAEQQLSKASGDIRKLQQQELTLWNDVYTGSSCFPRTSFTHTPNSDVQGA